MFFSFQNSKRMPRVLRRRSGQSMLEFAFVLPIFVALVLGVVQYGLLAQATELVTNLTRDGARFASIGEGQKDADIKQFILKQTNFTPLRREGETTDGMGNAKNDDISITITPVEGKRTVGEPVKIEVSYNLRSRIFLPITGTLLANFPKAGDDPLYISTSIMRVVD